MDVLIYQIIIFCTIYIIGLFGKTARNATTIAISIFTLLMIFTTWLSILQFITIFIAYYFSVIQEEKAKQSKLIKQQERNFNKLDNNNNSYYFFFLIVLAIVCAFSVTMNKKQFDNEPIKEDVETEKVENSNFQIPIYSTIDSTTSIDKEQLSDYDSINMDNYNSLTNYNDEDEDPYSNEDSYGIILNGEYEFAKNINDNEIANGSIVIRNINNYNFHFILKVNNQYSTGKISGFAVFIDATTAIFKNENCKQIYFRFLENEKIKIIEDDCLNYHGNRIGFDGIFAK